MSEEQNIDSIFCSAIEIESGAERSQYLQRVCGDNSDLFRQVERLIEAHICGGSVLDSPDLHIDATLDQSISERTGSQIGPYKLLQQLGEGGMGVVFMAEQSKPVQRRVALKIIKPGMDSRRVIARFEAERQALAMMDHPNIAKVLDVGQTDSGLPYFAMELVNGVPITQFCDEQHLTARERLELFIPICQAVQHAHQKGIIHRDIKPSNLLVALYDGRPVPKVIDFGVAKATAGRLTEKTMFTSLGQVIGTIEYMSPEQAMRNQLDIDTRSDVYSLGVVFYELLCGDTPFDKRRLRSAAIDELLKIIREEEPPKPSTRLSGSETLPSVASNRNTEPVKLNALIRGDLDWIAMKALEKNRSRRYDGAAALADDVRRFLGDEPVEARPPSVTYRLSKAFRKHKAVVAFALGLVVCLIVGLTGTGLMWHRAEGMAVEKSREATKAQNAEKTAREAEAKVRQARLNERTEREKAEATLARSNYFLAIARWDARRAKEAKALLDRIPLQYRHLEWRLAMRQFYGSDLTCYGHLAPVNCVAISPDGAWIASGGRDNMVRVWHRHSGEEAMTLPGHRDVINSVNFSPDGSKIASGGRDGTIRVWEATTGKPLRTINEHAELGRWVHAVCFSPDSSLIAAGSGRWTPSPSPNGFPIYNHDQHGSITVWKTSTGEKLWAQNPVVGPAWSVSFSPSGRRIASGGMFGTVRLWESDTGEESVVLKGKHHGPVLGTSFSPNGQRLATCSGDRTIKLWDASTGAEVRTLIAQSSVNSVSFAPDGAQIVTGARDGTLGLWDAVNGDALLTLTGHTNSVNSVRFTPDGGQIVSGSEDNTIKLWEMDAKPGMRSHRGHKGVVLSASFSPDGTRIASGSHDDTVRLWMASTGKVYGRLEGHVDAVSAVTFSPEGARIATGSYDGTIRLWDHASGKMIRTLNQNSNDGERIHSVCFSPDGNLIASGSGNWTTTVRNQITQYVHDNTGKVTLWDVATGRKLWEYEGHKGPVNSVSFSRNGMLLVSGSDDQTVRACDVATCKERWKHKKHLGEVTTVSFGPEGKVIASGSRDGTVRLWDAHGRTVATLRGHSGEVDSVSFSGDGARLASGGGDRTIRLWDTSTGQELTVVASLAWAVSCVAVSPDGSRLAAGSRNTDQTLKVWDAPTHFETRTLQGHTEKVTNVMLSPDGSPAYSQSATESFVWDATTGKRLENAEWPGTPAFSNKSSDGFWLAVPSNDQVLLVDRRFRDTAREKALKAESKLYWHIDRIYESERSADWYAAAFHRAWVWLLRPDSPIAYEGLQTAIGRLESAGMNRCPPIAKTALQLHPSEHLSADDLWKLGKRSKGRQEAYDLCLAAINKGTDAEPVQLGRLISLLHDIGEHPTEVEVANHQVEQLLLRLPPNVDPRRPVVSLKYDTRFEEQVRQLREMGFSTLDFEIDEESQLITVKFIPRWVLGSNSLFSWNFTDRERFAQLERSRSKDGWKLVKKRQYALDGKVRLTGLWHRSNVVEKQFEEARRLNNELWKSVVRPGRFPTKSEISAFAKLCNQFPQGMFFNTLGAAQYRARNYEAAIAASSRSLRLLPEEMKLSGPHPSDLAFLSMSHLQLDNKDQAERFREQMHKVMQAVAYKDDQEAKDLQMEVDALFTGKAAKNR